MDGTEGLVRGQEVVDTKTSIKVPVGPKTLGRIINVIGEPIDERGPVETERLAMEGPDTNRNPVQLAWNPKWNLES